MGLVLVAIIVYLVKFTNITNTKFDNNNDKVYQPSSQLFDMGAYLGLIILVSTCFIISIISPRNLK
ncbi:hypothetical protein [Entomoplasma ellychniae]|uniref:hypothetical protein n=1 Tax=Entomoplasma ellychniae TaxID=2114 RepID=UPI0011B0713A|nr:hypothetical protein [Entomoplasma ellychniae]